MALHRRTRRGQVTVEALAALVALAVVAAIVLAAVTRNGSGASLRPALREAAAARVVPTPALVSASAAALVDAPGLVAGGAVDVRVVAAARALLARGIREEPAGSNGGPAVLALTDGNVEPWCADMVSWVLRAAGAPLDGGLSGGWRVPSARGVAAWFAARGRYQRRASALPAAGDVVYFVHGRGHIGIVERVAGDVLVTIEGNAGDAVTRRAYKAWKTWWTIDGFGRPR